MRLIDADNLRKDIENLCPEFGNEDSSLVEQGEVLDFIEEQPTVDAVPVVHAYWILIDGGLYPVSQCSNPKCARLCETGGSFPYCPNCGARMDGGKS